MKTEGISYVMGTKPDITLCDKVKIGSTNDLDKRIRSGRTFSPQILTLFTAPGYDLEREAKEKFSQYRIATEGSEEWYQFVDKTGTIYDDLHTWIVENFKEYDYDDNPSSTIVHCIHQDGFGVMMQTLQDTWGFTYKNLEDYLGSGTSTVSNWIKQSQPFIRNNEVRVKLNELWTMYQDGMEAPFHIDRKVAQPRQGENGKSKKKMFKFELHTDLRTLHDILERYGNKVSCPTLAPLSQ